MSANQLTLWYLIASVCFILALKGLSSPTTARRGNLFGMGGMTIAVVTTIAVVAHGRIDLILIAMLIGGTIGAIIARRVQMTQMPELVAAMHSMVGMAAVLIAIAVVNNPAAFGEHDPLPAGNRLELFIGTFVGAITFSGSVIAFGKLAGLGKKFRLFSSAPVVFKGQHLVNLILALVMIGCGLAFFFSPEKAWTPFVVMTAIAFVLGVLIHVVTVSFFAGYVAGGGPITWWHLAAWGAGW
jgi:NAD(P) transhydrogenase subunit beta